MSDVMQIIIGYDNLVPIDISVSGTALVIDPSATVQAAIIKSDRSAIIAGPVTASSDADGADWGAGRVVMPFSKNTLADVTLIGDAVLEVAVDHGNIKRPFFAPVRLVRGLIG